MLIFSPYHRINQVPEQEVANYLIDLFSRKGHPGALRVDNGQPFGSPKASVTTALALWLIGSGIKMIWNPPYSPQHNGKVERNQDITWRWSEIELANSYEQAQKQLDQVVIIQRERFPVTRLKRKTRIEAFPELKNGARTWDEQNFSPERVYQYLAKKVYTRKVSIAGQITLFNKKLKVGMNWAKQYVQLKIDPTNLQWIIYDQSNQIIKQSPITYLSKERLVSLAVFDP